MTAASGSSAYCTAAQFVQHAADERVVRELLSDTSAAVTGDLAANALLAAVLMAASGEVESAACAGQRYVITASRNDLSSLTGNSAAYLAAIVASLALRRLMARRPDSAPDTRPTVSYEDAQDFLERLRLGERVLGILENHQAAALDSAKETRAEVEARRGVREAMHRYFGVRNARLQP